MTRSPQFVCFCHLLTEKSRATTDFNSVALLLTQQPFESFHCECGNELNKIGIAVGQALEARQSTMN
jgi:hypothetical protein